MNGETNAASSSKRRAEEEEEGKAERKRRRKAEKKAKKEKERLEMEGLTVDASNNVDSSKEFQSESKLKKKKNKKDEDNKSHGSAKFSNILEPDPQHLQTPKPKVNSSLIAPKTLKTPKDTFVLPSDFKVLKYKTEKSAWKGYQGPDGKKYRSIPEVKKYIETKTKKTIEDSTKVQLTSTSDSTVGKNNSQDEEIETAPKLGTVNEDLNLKKKKKIRTKTLL